MNPEQAIKKLVKLTPLAEFLPLYDNIVAGMTVIKATAAAVVTIGLFVSQNVRDRKKYDSMYDLKGAK